MCKTSSITLKVVLPLFLLNLLTACSSSIPLKAQFDEPPLFKKIDAKVGVVCGFGTHEFHFFKTIDGAGLYKVKFDEVSVKRFEQVFASIFSEVVFLPSWPPWQEVLPNFDGIILLDNAELSALLGDDMGRNAEYVLVRYRICLYKPDGGKVNCWETLAEQHHQRQAFERNLDIPAYLANLVDTASREAIAKFMMKFEEDPHVDAWVEKFAIGNVSSQ